MDESRIWHLVARKLSRECTLDELRELEQFLRDDAALAYRVEVYLRYFEHASPPARTSGEVDEHWNNFLKKANPDFTPAPVPPAGFFRQYGRSLAAMVLLLIIAAGTLWFASREEHAPKLVSAPAIHEMNTNPGTRTKLALADGTEVWLNSDSHLYYNADFGKTNREVTLTGEAFFDVVHNAELPMIVHARSVNILVRGTAFNVRNYPDASAVEASLLRGSIELTTNADPSRKILLKPNEKITIESIPDTAVAATPRAKITLPAQPYFHIDILHQSAISNTIPEVSWMQNKLVFDNEALSAVARKMEKWYNMQIIIRNRSLADRQVSGVFEKENISEALSALQLTIHFEFTIEGNKVYIK